MNRDGASDLLVPLKFSPIDSNIRFYFNNLYHATVSPASLTGTIHYAIPEVSLSPTTLGFGNVAADSSSTQAVSYSVIMPMTR